MIASSDVTRWRGVAIAALAAGVIVAILAARTHDDPPLARPHAQAKLTCASCHDDRPIASHCVDCHGAHPSTRAGHAGIGCPTCHPAHSGGGVAFAPDGSAIRYGAGAWLDAGTTDFHPRAPVNVPTPACAQCHGAGTPLRFDEHHPVRDASGKIAPRAAAWDAAAVILARAPDAPAPARPSLPWWWLAAGGLAALMTWAGRRGASAALRRRRAASDAGRRQTSRSDEMPRRLPVIDSATCLGCHACVEACPYDVLEVRRYVAVVARPNDCCGLTLCAQHCPNGSLTMGAPIETAPAKQPPAGMHIVDAPLIRDAIAQGTRAAGACTGDVVIIGAGPAGLAAALECAARGLRYVVLEQGSIAESIRSFPRGKLVIDPDLPPPGRLWIAETTKEELLARWLRQVREARLNILEHRRVVSVKRGFAVTDHTGAVHTAEHVIVAIGRRGSPRKLGVAIPPALESHVHYNLSDARSFAGQRVLVVGLGDVAMEAAVALSRQPGTEVTVSYRGDSFQRGKARNIAEMRRRVAAGAIRLVWCSEVTGLAAGRATLTTPDGRVEVPFDAVLTLIGQIARPFDAFSVT